MTTESRTRTTRLRRGPIVAHYPGAHHPGAAPASVQRYIMPVAFRMRLLLIVGGICCMVAWGQRESGSIAGSVFDPAHTPAAGISVEARKTETGTDYKAVSSAKGEYTLAQ